MKTKKILFVLSSIILSLFSSIVVASVTNSPIIGLGVFTLGMTTMSMQLKYPNLNIVGGSLFTLVNPGQLTFNGKEVASMTEAVMVSVYTNPDLAMIHQISENIVAKQQIAFLGVLGSILKKDAGCSSSPTSANAPLSEKFWNPTRVKFWLEQCADDLEGSFFVWGLNKGINRKDLEKTDFADFIMERIDNALSEDIQRIVWFADTAIANLNASPVGTLSNTSSVADFNQIDGLWKQIFASVALDSTKRITIANNTGNSYVNQAFTTADTTNKVVHGILQSMIDNADPRLSETEGLGLGFLVTKSIYNQYKKELKSYTNIEQSFVMVQNGQKVLTFDGIPIVHMTFWDRHIKTHFNNGVVTLYPHRALLTVKENIPVGVDGIEAMKSMVNFFLPKEETNNWKGGFKIDTKLMQDYLYMTAY